MIKLYGTSLSNNYNKPKLVLLEKGIPFEEVMTRPAKDEAFLARSPMGKIPFLEVDGKFLAESQAIMEYVEDAYPEPPLYPRDPWERARCRELIAMIELYMNTPATRLVGAAFFGMPVSDETKSEVMATWERALGALQRLATFRPYIAGNQLSMADCVAIVHLGLVSDTSKTVYGRDVLEALPGVAAYRDLMMKRPSVQTLVADQKAAYEAFMASRGQ